MAKGQKKQKQTPEVINKLEQAFSIDASIGEACYFADIGETTYHRWCAEDPELRERFKRLREKPILKARQVIAADMENPATAKWYLERKKSQEFSTQQDLGVNPDGGIGITVNMPEGYNGTKPDSTAS